MQLEPRTVSKYVRVGLSCQQWEALWSPEPDLAGTEQQEPGELFLEQRLGHRRRQGRECEISRRGVLRAGGRRWGDTATLAAAKGQTQQQPTLQAPQSQVRVARDLEVILLPPKHPLHLIQEADVIVEQGAL